MLLGKIIKENDLRFRATIPLPYFTTKTYRSYENIYIEELAKDI